MGFCKKCCASCLGCLCLIPMAWISFNFFGLDAAITGGLFTNIGEAITLLSDSFNLPGGIGTFLPVLLGGLIGFIAITIFPLHWLLYFRPDEPMFAIALILPWVLTSFLTSLLFAKSMKEGFMTPIIMGIIMIVFTIALLNFLIPAISVQIEFDITGIINPIIQGFAGLPEDSVIGALSASGIISMAIAEGALVGGCFGALAGAIRYNPRDPNYVPKTKAAPATTDQPTFEKF